MKYLLPIVLLFSFLLCEEYQDVVYLKNGSIIKGIIIEQIPNKSLKIKTADGSIFVYEMDEISKIAKEVVKNKYSYNNMLGGIYLNTNGTPIYGMNSMQRISGNVSAGFMWSTYYINDNLPGQNDKYIFYIGFDIASSKHFTPLLIVGGVLTYREWSSVNYYWGGVNGSFSYFAPLFGLGINVKLVKNVGFGFIFATAQQYGFTAYSDGSSVVYDGGYGFYPALTVNLYDIFPTKKK